MTMLVSQQAVPPHFTTEIAPMFGSKNGVGAEDAGGASTKIWEKS